MISHLELAQISQQVYFKKGGFVRGWECTQYYYDDKGFAVGVYNNNEKNVMVIAFRGPDVGDLNNFLKNIITEIQIIFGYVPNMTDVAKNFVARIREERSILERVFESIQACSFNQLYLTGHSLGGTLAHLVALEKLKSDKNDSGASQVLKTLSIIKRSYRVVTFENPGIAHLINPQDLSEYAEDINKNFLTYVADPNLINTSNLHLGRVRHVRLSPNGNTFFSRAISFGKNAIDCLVYDIFRVLFLLFLFDYFIEIACGNHDMLRIIRVMTNFLLTWLEEKKYISPLNLIDSSNTQFMFLMSVIILVTYNFMSELTSKTFRQHTLDNMINHFVAGQGEPKKFCEMSQWPSNMQYISAQIYNLLKWPNPFKHKSLLTLTRLDELREEEIQHMDGYKIKAL